MVIEAGEQILFLNLLAARIEKSWASVDVTIFIQKPFMIICSQRKSVVFQITVNTA
jgi:hypothetical protein